jgi:hypothetical protein
MRAATQRAPGSVLGIRSWRHRAAGHDLRQHVEVSDDDRTVATAEVTTSEGAGGTARVSLHAEAGHITPGRRASLVDAVLDLPEVQESARMEAAFRLGDNESLHRLQERCEAVSTRPAGWSALVDANLHAAAPGSASRTQPARNPRSARNDCMQPSRSPEGVLADVAVSLRVPPGVDTATLPATPPGKTAALARHGCRCFSPAGRVPVTTDPSASRQRPVPEAPDDPRPNRNVCHLP